MSCYTAMRGRCLISMLFSFAILVFLTGPALANFVETGTMTVQGNAFSVGTSTLAVVSGKVGIGVGLPAAMLDVAGDIQVGSGTAKSTFTAGGQLKLNAFGIQWADGTTSTTNATGAAGSQFAFASTTNSFVTTSTSWVAVTGTTVTISNMTGGRLYMGFACDLNVNSSGGYRAHGGFLVNGAFVDGETTSIGFVSSYPSGTEISAVANQWEHTTEGTWTGSVSVVPIVLTQGGGSVLVNEGTKVCQVLAQEVK